MSRTRRITAAHFEVFDTCPFFDAKCIIAHFTFCTMEPILENDQEPHVKGCPDRQWQRRKAQSYGISADKLKQRIEEHEAWLKTEAGKEWKQSQQMFKEDEASATMNAIFLYQQWYDEQNDKGYFVDIDDEEIINFGRKHKGKRFREVYDTDKDYVQWIKKLKREDDAVKRNPQFRKFVDYIKAVSFFDKQEK